MLNNPYPRRKMSPREIRIAREMKKILNNAPVTGEYQKCLDFQITLPASRETNGK